MSRWYTNIIKRRTHVTRDEALVCLNLNSEEFDRYCVLTDTHPFIPNKDTLTNRSTPIQYRITDIHRIRESEPYRKQKLKEENAVKRRNYKRTGREYKEAYLKDERIDYGKILLNKYPSFDDIFEDLGEAVTALILAERIIRKKEEFCIRFESDMKIKIRRELSLFYAYIMIDKNIEKTFLAKDGIYYSTEMHGYEVFWKEAYPLGDSEDVLGINYNIIVQNAEFNAYLLEKVNFKIFKEISHPYFVEYVREIRKTHTDRIEYVPLDKYSTNLANIPEETEEDESEEKQTKNTPYPIRSLAVENDEREEYTAEREDGSFGRIDVLEMVDNIPRDIQAIVSQKRQKVFKSTQFFLCESTDTVMHSLKMLIISGGGEIVREPNEKAIYICKEAPANFKAEYKYAHPQLIYDSINIKELQSHSIYRPGQEIPEHTCPYKSMLETSELDIFNLSERKKKEIESIINHRK